MLDFGGRIAGFWRENGGFLAGEWRVFGGRMDGFGGRMDGLGGKILVFGGKTNDRMKCERKTNKPKQKKGDIKDHSCLERERERERERRRPWDDVQW